MQGCKNAEKDFQQYIFFVVLSAQSAAPVAQRYPCNLLTRWDVSSIPANGIFLTKKLKTKKNKPNGGERLNR